MTLPTLTPHQRAQILRALGRKSLPGMKPYRPAPKPRSKPSDPAANAPRAIRCITTGETFPSITQAAAAHRVPPAHISTHLKRGTPTHVHHRTYEYLHTTPQPAARHSTAPRPVRCLTTGETFRSLSSAAKHYNIAPANLHTHLNGALTYVTGKLPTPQKLQFAWEIQPVTT